MRGVHGTARHKSSVGLGPKSVVIVMVRVGEGEGGVEKGNVTLWGQALERWCAGRGGSGGETDWGCWVGSDGYSVAVAAGVGGMAGVQLVGFVLTAICTVTTYCTRVADLWLLLLLLLLAGRQ